MPTRNIHVSVSYPWNTMTQESRYLFKISLFFLTKMILANVLSFKKLDVIEIWRRFNIVVKRCWPKFSTKHYTQLKLIYSMNIWYATLHSTKIWCCWRETFIVSSFVDVSSRMTDFSFNTRSFCDICKSIFIYNQYFWNILWFLRRAPSLDKIYQAVLPHQLTTTSNIAIMIELKNHEIAPCDRQKKVI